ncbi:MAG: HAD family hydrolase, partial [Ruminococcaceae bacterium]|nr:HAD family hydrolase [Oscillospiraceae bacterium]
MHYLFDFDGVLANSMPVWANMFVNLLKEFDLPVPEDFVKTITPLGNRGAIRYSISLGVPLDEETCYQKSFATLMDAYSNKIPLKTHVAETLRRLKNEGHTLHVLTASPHVFIDPCLRRCGIYDLFDTVWSIDDFSYSKAQVEIYDEVVARLQTTREECIFLDDNLVCLTTARRAGIPSIGVFDETSREVAEDIKRVADRYIMDFSEL